MTGLITGALEFCAVIVIVLGGFYLWAIMLLRQSDASAQAFSDRWKELNATEREEEIDRVRAAREMLEAKRR